MLRSINHTQPHSAQYFDLFNRLLQMSARVNPSQFGELLEFLINMLKEHPTIEVWPAPSAVIEQRERERGVTDSCLLICTCAHSFATAKMWITSSTAS
jgi:hypothetical protein